MNHISLDTVYTHYFLNKGLFVEHLKKINLFIILKIKVNINLS